MRGLGRTILDLAHDRPVAATAAAAGAVAVPVGVSTLVGAPGQSRAAYDDDAFHVQEQARLMSQPSNTEEPHMRRLPSPAAYYKSGCVLDKLAAPKPASGGKSMLFGGIQSLLDEVFGPASRTPTAREILGHGSVQDALRATTGSVSRPFSQAVEPAVHDVLDDGIVRSFVSNMQHSVPEPFSRDGYGTHPEVARRRLRAAAAAGVAGARQELDKLLSQEPGLANAYATAHQELSGMLNPQQDVRDALGHVVSAVDAGVVGADKQLHEILSQNPDLAQAWAGAHMDASAPNAGRRYGLPAALVGGGLALGLAEPMMEVARPTAESFGTRLADRFAPRPDDGAAQFNEMLRTDPMLSQASPEERLLMHKAYGSMRSVAPTLAQDPFASQNYLRTIMSTGAGPDYATIGQLARVERDLTKD